MTNKKSIILGCSDEEFEEIFNRVRSIFVKVVDDNLPFGELVKKEIIDFYLGKPTFAAALYLTGEIYGKIEMGVKIEEIGKVIFDALLAQVKKDTNTTDQLLRYYSHKKIARC